MKYMFCYLCRCSRATQKRYPKVYHPREKGTPVCDFCARIWDEEGGIQ